MNTPELPRRIFLVTGKLRLYEPENNPSHLSSRMVVQDDERNIYFLNEGDLVSTPAWSETVVKSLGDNEYLNGNMGMLFTRKEADAVRKNRIRKILQRMKNPDSDVARQMIGPGLRHYFISFPPQKRAEMEKWIDALHHENRVWVQFCIPPFAAPSQKFVAGYLDIYHEQGMEDTRGWIIVDSQKISYAAHNKLAVGDYLIIYRKNGRNLYWQGHVTEDFLETLNNQIDKWFKGPTKVTKKGTFLARAFEFQLPAVLIRR